MFKEAIGLSAALKRADPVAYWAEYDAAEGAHRDLWYYGRHGCEWHVREALPCEYRGVLFRQGESAVPEGWSRYPAAIVAIRYRDGCLERWFGPVSSPLLLYGERGRSTFTRHSPEGWWRYLEAMHESGNGSVLWDMLGVPVAVQ
ncbi:hypothetical protein W911_00275 [Hyphomicrobium nitrativorans NL23]|uniref:Uncharacterized protein n=1 Tax=Hyphomicrobium nitrativorans NL23 TaxID=1029756 RepID=V5SIM3_9HYPH|nr:hypothetical protein [Hyphomicrobium nitrativorans]AHB49789.1 hypothetical protein W911_00275 [Hyphomicrobium nitrativorans NL23]